ncbi:hypothetical protein D3C71_344020 [compost metagenome]
MYQNNLLSMATIKKIVEVHISTISIGDSIICNDGLERTIGKGNIKRDSFLGISILGDTYRFGRLPVKKVIYEKSITLGN